MMNSKEREVRVKQEGTTKITPSSRSQWSSHKNPRIVRVSRSFGGKDRHSKVCTVRGLRDRRIRLSVPTAIQLYDLQDRLGLNQPSKVVDWLLDATKDDIDNLPPLPTIPGTNFTHFYNPNNESPSPAPAIHHPQSSLSHFLASNPPFAKNLEITTPSKQGVMNKMDNHVGERVEQQNHEGFGGFVAQLSAQNLFPLGNLNNHHHHHHQSQHFPNFNPYFHWDHPNLSLSHFGGAYPLPNQAEDQQHNTLSAVVPSTSHLYFCPNATAAAAAAIPPFAPYIAPSIENVQQNLGFSTALHLMSSPTRAFAFNANSKPLHPQQNGAERPEKDDD